MKKFGIINLSQDSFSGDGNLNFKQIQQKMAYFKEKNYYGIDVGAQSTNPHSKLLEQEAEFSIITGIFPIISAAAKALNLEISIDTFYPKIAKFAVLHGCKYINDVSGLKFPEIIDVLRENQGVKYILMHSLCAPARSEICVPQSENIVEVILDFFHKKLEFIGNNGIDINRVALDPGIGFGKSAEQNWEILRNIVKFTQLNLPIYLGISRKSFLSCVSNNMQDRDISTATILKMLENTVNFTRIHF